MSTFADCWRAVFWLPALVLLLEGREVLALSYMPPNVVVSGLYRHAVKGLSADVLTSVGVRRHESFKDDRRFALWLDKGDGPSPEEDDPVWIHKENFLCAFSDPFLMANFRAEYSSTYADSSPSFAAPCDEKVDGTIRVQEKLLKLFLRESGELILGPIDLATSKGRSALADFFSEQSGKPLRCITHGSKHQFGNTSSRWKDSDQKDTRTIHIVNKATVEDVSRAIGCQLRPSRFRPNIVLQGDLPAWEEFKWIGKKLKVGGVYIRVLSRTVRCQGVSVDPLDQILADNELQSLDIPKLLAKHFPEHGPYLGVYAVIESDGIISLGDEITIQD